MKGQQLLAGNNSVRTSKIAIGHGEHSSRSSYGGAILDLLTALRLLIWFRNRSMWPLIIFCFRFGFLFILFRLFSFVFLLNYIYGCYSRLETATPVLILHKRLL